MYRLNSNKGYYHANDYILFSDAMKEYRILDKEGCRVSIYRQGNNTSILVKKNF